MNTVLITGGAGFVGSNLGALWKRDFPDDRVFAFDNLTRKGSELALPRLQAAGMDFVRGDVRNPGDLDSVGAADLVLDCSAEPSVQAGYPSTRFDAAQRESSGRGRGSPRYLLDTNLGGTLNCLEFARTRGARLVFLSTSRVYPIQALRNIPLNEGADRVVLPDGSKTLLPAAWTDLEPTLAAAEPAAGSLADLLDAVALVAALLARGGPPGEQTARQPPTKENHRAAHPAQSDAGPGAGATPGSARPTARNAGDRGNRAAGRSHRQDRRDGPKRGGPR
jgi:hypothetical protein